VNLQPIVIGLFKNYEGYKIHAKRESENMGVDRKDATRRTRKKRSGRYYLATGGYKSNQKKKEENVMKGRKSSCPRGAAQKRKKKKSGCTGVWAKGKSQLGLQGTGGAAWNNGQKKNKKGTSPHDQDKLKNSGRRATEPLRKKQTNIAPALARDTVQHPQEIGRCRRGRLRAKEKRGGRNRCAETET